MLAAILQKLGFTLASDWVKNNVSTELVTLVLFLFLIVWIALRINKVVAQAHDKEEEQNTRLAVCEKRTEKIINAICETPCFKGNSANCIWLQRDDRNGGSLPDAVACPLLKEREARRDVG